MEASFPSKPTHNKENNMYKKISRIVFIVVVSALLIVQPVHAGGGKPPQYDGTIIGPNGEIYYVDLFEEVGRPTFPLKL